MEEAMPIGEAAYFGLAVFAFGVFCITLFWVSSR
jgi:hypothetical protein